MGSWRHAKRSRSSGEHVAGMIALETLGYFSDEPGSQEFPSPFGLVYPDRGNFVAFVGLPGSRALRAPRHRVVPPPHGVPLDRRRRARASSKASTYSDHWAYHQFGYSGPHGDRHRTVPESALSPADDLPDTVDYESLARITKGIERMLRELVR